MGQFATDPLPGGGGGHGAIRSLSRGEAWRSGRSPLFGNLRGLPPVRVHVGEEGILLEGSRRYVAQAVEAGVGAKLDVWHGVPHGFVGSIGSLSAAGPALEAVGAFRREQLSRTS